MIKSDIANLVQTAIESAQASGALPRFDIPAIEIARAMKPEHGDYSTSLALKLAGVVKRAPLEIARVIAANVPAHPAIARVEAAAPGFVNFILSDAWVAAQVPLIFARGEKFGHLDVGRGEKVQVEYVSANPTGPVTVGSARNAAIGDTLANILVAAGYAVQRENYINDAGSQIRHLGESVYARYAQMLGRDEVLPEDGYKGEYVGDIARAAVEKFGDKYLHVPRAEAIRALGGLGIEVNRAEARETLAMMGVQFDAWKSERSLYESGLFAQVVDKLNARGVLYEQDDATWFKASEFGTDKDAVIIRSPKVIPDPDERPTYLASDIAYVWDKLVLRNFARAIYVWGADHQGDVPRVKAVAKALGLDPARVIILLYQLVTLKRGGEAVRMSKRAGEFVTLREVLDEVGADAIRFNLLTRSHDSAMDFDLQLAKEQSEENPVYYVQYAHARIASIFRTARERGVSDEGADVALLKHPAELALIRMMLRLEDTVELAAQKLEPHHLTHYAQELAATFHQFYKQCRVVSSLPEDAEISKARLLLVRAAKLTLAQTLELIGVNAPEAM